MERTFMEIKYSTSKKEIMHFYKERWKEKLWKFHIFIYFGSIFVIYNMFENSQLSNVAKISLSSAIGLLILLLMPLIPMIMHKKQERSLSITDKGIVTTIGKKNGSIPWEKIDFVKEEQDYIYIIGKNQNGFIIPKSAFIDTESKDKFFKTINEYTS